MSSNDLKARPNLIFAVTAEVLASALWLVFSEADRDRHIN